MDAINTIFTRRSTREFTEQPTTEVSSPTFVVISFIREAPSAIALIMAL